jgi:two-component sensor histidine kinase
LDFISSLIFVKGLIILIAAVFFAYYSLRSVRFKKGVIGRQIMVLGVAIFLIAAFLDNLYLWNNSIRSFSAWILFFLWSAGIIVIGAGSYITWKNIQKIYDIPLSELTNQISEIQHHLLGILFLLISIPVDLLISLAIRHYFTWLTVVKTGIWALGFLVLAISSRVEYRSIEEGEESVFPFDQQPIKQGKISTLREDIALTYAFTYLVNSFLASITPILGRNVIQSTLKSWEEEHPILFQDFKKPNKCSLQKNNMVKNLDRIYEKDRLSIIMDEFSSFLAYLVDLVGKVTNYRSANRILRDSYEKLEKQYSNHPIVIKILRIIPFGLLEDKKLGLLTKEELEQKVRERTAELQKSNKKLKAEIEERKEAEKKLKKSLQEKEVLLKEIHHRVKNNLQVISSLLNLQSKKIKDKEALEAFSESCDRIRTMASIHNQLYRHENLAEINFGQYIEDLTSYLFRSYKGKSNNIKLDIKVDDEIALDIGTAIPCGLIVNELVTNSLKYAFPETERGRIKIILDREAGGNLKLEVSDNGIGLGDDFSFDNRSTLGSRLVKRLVDQLDGKIEFDSSNGAKFFITFPAS